ncbi:MAG: UvrD-helicase domain-containing protein, partial [Clostridiales bacterium]|nr:UvrD-helicase domain-containing protein [Clostridiales bacterium]
MAGRNWTKEQSDAIRFRGGNLLVAAGAGSGKTSVLVERVVRLIGAGGAGEAANAGENAPNAAGAGAPPPVGIDRLLIVTFTNAAAAEMKERIAAALTAGLEALEEEAGSASKQSERLRRQLILLGSASISTIHAFCMSVIKENLNQIAGLDSAFRLMDGAEAALLKADALNEVLEEKYAEEGNTSFAALVESFGAGRDDRGIGETILSVYDFVQSAPWPDEWLRAHTALFCIRSGAEFSASVWAREITERLAEGLDALTAVLAHEREILFECLRDDGKRREVMRLIDQIGRLRVRCEDRLAWAGSPAEDDEPGITDRAESDADAPAPADWDSLRAAVLALGRMECLRPRAARGEDPETKLGREAVKAAVDRFLNDVTRRYFQLDTPAIIEEFERSHALLLELSDVVGAFSRKFAELKKARSVLDFNDLEHFALEILLTRDTDEGVDEGADAGAAPRAARHAQASLPRLIPTEAALSYQKRYAEVLVDEYQDSNLVQEYIIRAVSKQAEARGGVGGSVFMVGDVKQSIYRFRQAMPELFLEKYRTYRPSSGGFGAQSPRETQSPRSERDKRDAPGTKILLYRNFRSDPGILRYINTLFGGIMSRRVGDLDYTEEEWLLPGAAAADEGEAAAKTSVPGVAAKTGSSRPVVEVHVISKKAPDTAADMDHANDTGDGEGDGDGDGTGGSGADGDADGEARENESNVIYEARLVAQKIAELMCSARPPDPDGLPNSDGLRDPDGLSDPDGLPRPLAYRDMVVLM